MLLIASGPHPYTVSQCRRGARCGTQWSLCSDEHHQQGDHLRTCMKGSSRAAALPIMACIRFPSLCSTSSSSSEGAWPACACSAKMTTKQIHDTEGLGSLGIGQHCNSMG